MTETLQKKFRIEIWAFCFQICFWNQFLTLGSGQNENTQIRIFVYFLFDYFPKSKIYFESIFLKKWPYFYQFFLKEFRSVFKKVKNGFHIVFSKSDLTGVGSIFFLQKNTEKAKHPKICLSLRGSMPVAQIKQCLLTPSPILTWVQSDPLVDRSCGFVEDIPEVILQGETPGRLLLCRFPLDGARSLDGSC